MKSLTKADLVMKYHESYGAIPTHLLRMVKRFNVSPADWDALIVRHDTDWQSIREDILAGVPEGTRSYNSFLVGL